MNPIQLQHSDSDGWTHDCKRVIVSKSFSTKGVLTLYFTHVGLQPLRMSKYILWWGAVCVTAVFILHFCIEAVNTVYILNLNLNLSGSLMVDVLEHMYLSPVKFFSYLI